MDQAAQNFKTRSSSRFPGDLVGNVGWFTTLMNESSRTWIRSTLERTVHPTVWINAMDRSLCTMRDDVHSELPPGAIVAAVWHVARVRGIALLFLPRPRYCYSIVHIPSHSYVDRTTAHTRLPQHERWHALILCGRVQNFKQCLERIFLRTSTIACICTRRAFGRL